MMYRIGFSLLAVVLAGGCSRDGAGPTSPDGGALHITKECSAYTRLAGGFCTITSSNVKEIEVGTQVIYAAASGATVLDSDVILYRPGTLLDTDTAKGHCKLDLASGVGLCTFSGGIGKFASFNATAAVSSVGRPNWAWDGTYSFSSRE